jgi:hypothetical protein
LLVNNRIARNTRNCRKRSNTKRSNTKRRTYKHDGGDIHTQVDRAQRQLESIQRQIGSVISELSIHQKEPGQHNNAENIRRQQINREVARVARVRAEQARAGRQ